MLICVSVCFIIFPECLLLRFFVYCFINFTCKFNYFVFIRFFYMHFT